MDKEKIKEWKKYTENDKWIDLTFVIKVENGKYIVEFDTVKLSNKVENALKALGDSGYGVDMSGCTYDVLLRCVHRLRDIAEHREEKDLNTWKDVEMYLQYVFGAVTRTVNELLFDFVSFQEEEADKLGIYHMEI